MAESVRRGKARLLGRLAPTIKFVKTNLRFKGFKNPLMDDDVGAHQLLSLTPSSVFFILHSTFFSHNNYYWNFWNRNKYGLKNYYRENFI